MLVTCHRLFSHSQPFPLASAFNVASTLLMSANEKSLIARTGESEASLINETLRSVLAILWRAYVCAQDMGANAWDLALPAGRLYETGVKSSELRWLIAKGFAESGQRTPGHDGSQRSFQLSGGYFFNEDTCLILTPSGAALAEHIFGEHALSSEATLPKLTGERTQANAHDRIGTSSSVKPRWDRIRRELSLSGLIVKRFRVPARNQETILGMFEEREWAEHIIDPLPVSYNVDAPTRLHDAINRLNRCQINPLLRFHGDGKGTGVFWEIYQPHMLG